MGFSVSGSTAVLLVGLVIGVGIAYPAIMGSVETINDARQDQADRLMAQQNSGLELQNVTYDDSEDELTVSVENTGTLTFEVAATDLLVDGDYRGDADTAVEADGDSDPDAELWQPGEVVTFTVEGLDLEPGDEIAVKVVAETGVADRTEHEVG